LHFVLIIGSLDNIRQNRGFYQLTVWDDYFFKFTIFFI